MEINPSYQTKIRIGLLLSLMVLLTSHNMSWAGRGNDGPKPVTQTPINDFYVQSMNNDVTPQMLADALAGEGVTISNVSYTGASLAAGQFYFGNNIIGFSEGIALSTGFTTNVMGPNVATAITGENGTAGDAALTQLAGYPTYDAAVLSFDFVPNGATIFFRYVFSSEEYNEYVWSEYNDVFAFYVNGYNCAVIEGDPVSVNTINRGNPYGTYPYSHPELFINNVPGDGGVNMNFEMDGLTKVLTCTSLVTPNVVNHMRLAIADASDSSYDTTVFIQAGSLTTIPTDASVTDFGGETAASSSATVWLVVITAVVVGAGWYLRRRTA